MGRSERAKSVVNTNEAFLNSPHAGTFKDSDFVQDKELEELRETLIQISRIGDHWDCDDSCAESWELTEYAKAIKDLIAQERRKAKIEVLEKLKGIDAFNEAYSSDPRPSRLVSILLAELKEDKE